MMCPGRAVIDGNTINCHLAAGHGCACTNRTVPATWASAPDIALFDENVRLAVWKATLPARIKRLLNDDDIGGYAEGWEDAVLAVLDILHKDTLLQPHADTP